MADKPDFDRIFCAAVEIASAEDRAAYLNAACCDDAELLARLQRLVAAHFQAGTFLQKPAVSPSPTGLAQDSGTSQLSMAFPTAPGVVIGPYKLIEQIGEGGMGAVWMAEQKEPVKRLVALKLIKPGMDSRQVIARFEAERQALALMDHANIARVLDAGTTSAGQPYFVMDLVRGVPITRYCDEHHLTPRQRLELFIPVCQAIQHAHQKGIIHRDLKPSNVLVALYDGKPVPKVIDFGVAKATGQSLTDKTLVTGFGNIVGTLEYMSPEQAETNQLDIDTRSDIYSLGVLLYELLTGSPPFSRKELEKAGMLEMLRVIREEEPSKPSTKLSTAEGLPTLAANRGTEPAKLTRQVRGELDWIVMKALEKDRSRRYETANNFAMDVQRYLADEPVHACPPSAAYRFGKFARRNRGTLAIASVALSSVLLALIGLIISNVLITQEKNLKVAALDQAKLNEQAANTQKGIAERNATKAHEQERIAVANEQLANRRYYAAQMNLAMQAWEAGQAARVLALLESQRPKIDEEDLRTFEWHYLWRLCQGGLRRRFPAVNFDNSAVLALSPDGLTLATGFGNDVKLWETLTGQEKKTLKGHSNLVQQLEFTSGGTLISSDNNTIRTWNPATATEQSTPILGNGRLHGRFAVSGDGKTLVIDRSVGITLCDLTTGQQTVVAGSAGRFHEGRVAVDAGAQRVAAYRDDSHICVWERDGASWQELSPIPERGYELSLAFSPDGKSLAVGGTLKCYDPATGQLQRTLVGHTGVVLSVGYSADGKTLVSTGHDQTARLWDAATGRQLVCLAHPVIVHGAALSADGKVAATAGDGVRVWDTTPPEEAVILAHTAPVSAVSLSRDGKILASAGSDGTKLWNLPERQVVTKLPPSKDVAFFPDDKALALFRSSATIELFSVTGERQAELKGHASAVSLAISPNGKRLASAGYEPEAILWDLRTRQQRSKLKISGQLPQVAFSLDGQILAAGSQFGAIKLFEAATGRETATLQRYEFASTYISGLAWSRDSALVAAGNYEGQVQVWEVATGRLDAALRGHVGTVRGLSFSPDGRTLATASADHTVKLWDVATGQERFTLKGHQGPVHDVEFTPDGNTLITASGDGTVRLWLAAADEKGNARKQELDWNIPGTPAACHERGDALWQYGHLDQAEQAYAEAAARLQQLTVAFPESVELKREMIRSLLTRSLLLGETGRAQEAGPLRERAHAIYDNLTASEQQALIWEFCERGRKLTGIGNHRQSERTYTQVIEFEPTHVMALICRRWTNIVLGVWDKVAVDSSQLIELYPNDAAHWNWRGFAYSRQGQHEKALGDYTQAIQRTAQDPALWRNRGDCYSELGQLDEAIADYSQAFKLNPQDSAALNRRALVFDKLRQYERAQADWKAAAEILRKSIARSGGDSVDWFALANVHWRRGDKTLAHNSFQLAVQGMGLSREPPEQLHRLRSETATLLELSDSPPGIDSHASSPAGIDAETSLRRTIDLVPESPVLNRQLGTLLAGQGRFAEAEPFLSAAVRLAPQQIEGRLELANLLRQQKKFAEAEAEIREAIQLDPERARTHDMLGSVLREQKKFVEAEAAFRDAVRLMPELASAQRGLGLALHQQRKFAEAIEPLQAAIRLNPNDDWAHQTLGWALLDLRRFPEAEAALRIRIRSRPGDAGAHYALGRALQEQKKFAEAVEPLREALRLDPTRTNAHGILGSVFIEQEKLPEAEAAFREAVRLNPSNHYARAKVASTLFAQAEFAEAETEFRELIRQQADSFEGHYGLGRALASQKKHAEAVAPLWEAIRLDPKQAGPHGTIGWAHMHLQQFPDAEKAFREQIRLSRPDSTYGLEGLGKALMKQGKYLEAIAPLREGVRLDADNHLFREALGWALLRTGELTEAEAEFRRAIGLKPDWVPGHLGLGRALVEQKKFAEAEAPFREALRLEPENKDAAKLLEQAKRGSTPAPAKEISP